MIVSKIEISGTKKKISLIWRRSYGGMQRALRAGGGANRMRGRRGCRRPGKADAEGEDEGNEENETKRSKQRCRGRRVKGRRAPRAENTR